MEILTYVLTGLISIPFIVHIIWMVKTFKRKKYRVFFLQILFLTIFIVFFGVYFKIIPGSHLYWERIETKEITGKSFYYEGLEFSYDSGRSLNGDGCSIEIFNLEEHIAKEFINPSTEFFTQFPKKSSYRKNWEVEFWKAGPINRKEMDFVNFALMCDQHNPVLKKYYEQSLEYLNQGEIFYSYIYNLKENISDIDLFILIPLEKKLIVLNRNS